MTKFIQVFTTVPKKSEKEKIARVLSENKLSACTQIIGPITSIYQWKGKVKKSREFLLIIKTKKSRYHEVERMIKSIHPYDLPEIIALPIVEGSKEYLKWLETES